MHDALTARRTVILSPAGMPPFRLNFTYSAILSMEDAAALLAQWRIDNAIHNPTTPIAAMQRDILEATVLSA